METNTDVFESHTTLSYHLYSVWERFVITPQHLP